jgi:hypothetical protein
VKHGDALRIVRNMNETRSCPGKHYEYLVPADEVITDLRGQHDLVDDFDGFVDRVCDALGA